MKAHSRFLFWMFYALIRTVKQIILTMKRLTFTHEDIKFSLSEYPFPDTVNFRVHLPFPDVSFARDFDYTIESASHFFKNIEVDKTSVAFDLIRSEYAEFFDVQVSLAKLFFGGKNTEGFTRRQAYNENWSWKLNCFKAVIRKSSGIEKFNSLTVPLSRFDVGLNLQCESLSEAEILRDYFSLQKIPHLVARSPQEINTRYWNNRTAYKADHEGKHSQPNRVFACYVTDDNRVRLETRLYNRRGVTAIKYRTKFRDFRLENNLRSLSNWDFMNHYFWNDAIHLFDKKDRPRIVEAYGLNA